MEPESYTEMMKICIFFGDMQTGINTQSIRFPPVRKKKPTFHVLIRGLSKQS